MAKTSNRLLFWWVVVAVVTLDFITKQMAVAQLSGRGPVYILGDWLSLRLVYNPGAAFGINVGTHSRWVFMVLALVALVVLGAMVRQTSPKQWFRLLTLGLVCGGAIGNLIDRIRSPRGVVDFIDVWITDASTSRKPSERLPAPQKPPHNHSPLLLRRGTAAHVSGLGNVN